MKFHNPWIDPRVVRVQPKDVQAYLARRGWQLLGPASDPHLLRYELEQQADTPTLFVPVQMDEGPALQWMIELLGELASYEGRWAADVVEEILRQTPAGNGSNGACTAQPSSSTTPPQGQVD